MQYECFPFVKKGCRFMALQSLRVPVNEIESALNLSRPEELYSFRAERTESETSFTRHGWPAYHVILEFARPSAVQSKKDALLEPRSAAVGATFPFCTQVASSTRPVTVIELKARSWAESALRDYKRPNRGHVQICENLPAVHSATREKRNA